MESKILSQAKGVYTPPKIDIAEVFIEEGFQGSVLDMPYEEF